MGSIIWRRLYRISSMSWVVFSLLGDKLESQSHNQPQPVRESKALNEKRYDLAFSLWHLVSILNPYSLSVFRLLLDLDQLGEWTGPSLMYCKGVHIVTSLDASTLSEARLRICKAKLVLWLKQSFQRKFIIQEFPLSKSRALTKWIVLQLGNWPGLSRHSNTASLPIAWRGHAIK